MFESYQLQNVTTLGGLITSAVHNENFINVTYDINSNDYLNLYAYPTNITKIEHSVSKHFWMKIICKFI